jgi:fumarylacetoacetase
MNPLGPLNGKSFGTTISPWIITLDALAPFKVPSPQRNPGVKIAEYLQDGDANSSYDFKLSASIQPQDSPEASIICESQFSSLYWTLRDLVAHQTSNGCNLNIGDLLATGTISGNTKESRGCLMELASAGGVEIKGPNGKIMKRVFLEDGDIVALSAVADPGVGFGECVGRVLPAK